MNKKRVAKIGLIGILFICVFLGVFTIKKQYVRAGFGKEVSNLKAVDVTTNSFKLTWDKTSGRGTFNFGNKYKNIYPTMWEYTKKGKVSGINGYVCITTR